jgi:hypothetical protein
MSQHSVTNQGVTTQGFTKKCDATQGVTTKCDATQGAIIQDVNKG